MMGLRRVVQTPEKCDQNPVLRGDGPGEGQLARILGHSVHFDADDGLRRFAHHPTYAFPWHGDVIPVPYQ